MGMHAVLTHQDSLITSYRDHAIHLNRGGTGAARHVRHGPAGATCWLRQR